MMSASKLAMGVIDFTPGEPICDRGVRFALFKNPFVIPRARFVIRGARFEGSGAQSVIGVSNLRPSEHSV